MGGWHSITADVRTGEHGGVRGCETMFHSESTPEEKFQILFWQCLGMHLCFSTRSKFNQKIHSVLKRLQ